MKNLFHVLYTLLIIRTVVSCDSDSSGSSSDDNKGVGDSKYLENVPKGEIVSEEQRFAILTG